LQRVVAAATGRSPASFVCPRGCGTFTGFAIQIGVARLATSVETPSSPEDEQMSERPATSAPQEVLREPRAPHPLEVPNDGEREDVDSLDAPSSEGDPDGYGHGV
jgi:hypothetical protein